MRSNPETTRRLRPRAWVPLLMLAAMALAVVGHGFLQTLAPDGGTDFHSYWYYGHFIRQGANPYRAYLSGDLPETPVDYLGDREAHSHPLAQPGLATTPANTAPFLLALSPLSHLSWPHAKVAWFLVNLLLAAAVPILAIRLLPDHASLPWTDRALVFLVFFALQGTRISLWVGQTTLLAFALLLGAMLMLGRHWLASGLTLGLALSKYSLTLPGLLVALLERRGSVVAVSITVQLAGLVAVAVWGGDSPLAVAEAYVHLARLHTGLPGIHLAGLFGGRSIVAAALVLVCTLAVGGLVWRQYSGGRWTPTIGHPHDAEAQSLQRYHVLTALMLWMLLVTYHRAYDSLVVILFVALAAYGLRRTEVWRLSSRQSLGLKLYLAAFILVMSIPSSLMALVLPAEWMPAWYDLVGGIMTVALVSALGATLWLMNRFGEIRNQDRAHQRSGRSGTHASGM